MKSLKKVLVLVVAFAMLFSLAVPAFVSADETPTTYTITITNPAEGHTYAAYQIFAGELKDGKLAKVTWGSGVTLKEDDTLTVNDVTKTAAEWAEELGKITTTDADLTKAFADAVSAYLTESATKTSTPTDGGYEITGLEAGYYLVKDANKVTGQDAATRYILQVVGNVEVEPKSSYPTLDKQVLDVNDSDSDVDGEDHWNETADHDIGDSVSFRLIGTLPSTYDDYARYRYVFHDRLSDGLTFDGESSVTVKVVTGEGTEEDPYEETEIVLEFEVVTEDLGDGCSFHVVFKNLKLYEALTADHKIIVYYSATLNENAKIGAEGNPNDAKLQFSNDPNYKGTGKGPDEEEPDEPTGETPEDTVIVFTYELDVDKVGEDGETALPGAGFTLWKNVDGEWKAVKFELHEVYGEDDLAEEVVDSYYVVAGYVDADDEDGVKACELGVSDMTNFRFAGLDDGEYKLVESTVPKDYNPTADIEFTISAKHDDETETLEEVKFTVGENDEETITDGEGANLGIGSTTVVNKTGSSLPSTGGIGTTIFYIVGGLLVVFTGVLLITKRRMKSQKEC